MHLSNKDIAAILIAGLLAGGLFLFVIGAGLGFLFMFIPTLPLLVAGMGRRSELAFYAALLASLLIALAGGLPIALIFAFFFGLPAWYIATKAMRRRESVEELQWYPVGLIINGLTLYACATVALMAAYYATEEGISAMIGQSIRSAFAGFESEFAPVIDAMAGQLSFLIFSISTWLWGLALYGHAWLAHKVLAKKDMQQRPDFTIVPFIPPGWMLTLLAICALASLIGSPDMRFLGKSTLVSLMLPYFLCGAALMHQTSASWPSRGLFLFFIYLVIFVLFWPALILSGMGIMHQIKGLSVSKNSSKH